MKKKWLLALLAAAVLGALAFGLTRWTICTRHGQLPSRLENADFLTRELRLSDEQAASLAKLHLALNTKLADCCQRHCAARARLGGALNNETNGTAQARMIVGEMVKTYEESELVTLEHIQNLRAILSPEQKRRFDELITECLCQACPVCGRSAKAAPAVVPGAD